MNESQPTYEFGPFRLNTNKKLLWRDDEPVALAPKVLDTLLVLIELRARVVTKDELLERVWGRTVVEEGGLARNISLLRKAIGEKPDQHTYIVTVPGKGYRFVADVREAAGAHPNEPVESSGAAAELPPTPSVSTSFVARVLRYFRQPRPPMRLVLVLAVLCARRVDCLSELSDRWEAARTEPSG